jgi:hypothetical protein
MSRVFSYEYHAFHGLFEYVGDGVFEMLHFLWEFPDGINE